MVTYRCDGCGKELPKHALRYGVEIEVKAAYDKMQIGLVDLVRNHRAEMLALIERLKHKDPSEIEETVYKRIKLDLCPACQRAYIRSPLRFHPEQGAPESDVDIDGFLRSLGVAGLGDDADE